ncbi:MAG: hypothetical protein FWE25_10010 [Lachnospiraceae bacterium]|nr:hypothetical protein [Lachnospiraceae bacterium]
MSMDMIVYIQSFENITVKDYEAYLRQFAMQAKIQSDMHFDVHTSGFFPFKVEFPNIESLKTGKFISGFEFYVDDYDYVQELTELQEMNESYKVKVKKEKKKFSFFGKMTASIREDSIKTSKMNFIMNEEADGILKQCKHRINLVAHGLSEETMVYAAASYLAEVGKGVISDPQLDVDYYSDISQKMTVRIKESINALSLGVMHPWEEDLSKHKGGK